MKLPACPVCGHEPALPSITPEMLYFRSTHLERPKVAAQMPDGSYAVAFGQVIYTMTAADWERYRCMSQAASVMDERLTREAA